MVLRLWDLPYCVQFNCWFYITIISQVQDIILEHIDSFLESKGLAQENFLSENVN